MPPTKTYSLAPRPGRGLFTAWSRFSMGDFEDSFSAWSKAVVRDNSWEVITDPLLSGGSPLASGGGLGTGPVWQIYYYNAINTASAAAAPTTAFLALVGGGTSPLGLTATLNRYDTNVPVLYTDSPHQLCFLTIKNRCFVAGTTLVLSSVPTILTQYPAATQYPWGIAEPTAQLSYSAYTGFTHDTTMAGRRIYYNAGGGGTGINGGAGVLAATSPDNKFVVGTWDGKTLITNSGTETYKISSVTTTANLTTTTNHIAFVNAPYEVHYGQLSWGEEPPKYAYSYYNPTTGHSSSISPVLRLSEQNMTDVGIEIAGIPTTGDTNYTHIILWRNDVNGGSADLMPLKLDTSSSGTGHGGTAVVEFSAPANAIGLIRNTGVGTVTYWDNVPDSERGRVVGTFREVTDNEPPPADIKFMEYWDGRVWATTVSAPWRLRYSKRTSPDVLGVGEESFPSINFIDIPSDDGLVTGMRAVGGTLLVCTDRFLYVVPSNYESGAPLDKISARGGGVNHYAIDDHPGDTTNNAASAIYVSRDKRLWRHYLGGKLEDLGAPIQDKLNDAPTTGLGPVMRPFLVKVFNVGKSWLCAVGILNSSLRTYYNWYFFDFDSLCWYDLGFVGIGTPALCIGAGVNFSNGAVGYAHMGKNTGNSVWQLMDPTLSGAVGAYLQSQWIDFGSDMGKKTVEEIVFFVSDIATPGWACEVRFDGSTGAFTSLAQYDPASTPRYRGPGIIHWNMRNVGPKQWHSIQIKATLANHATVPPRLYKIEFRGRAASSGEAGLPSG